MDTTIFTDPAKIGPGIWFTIHSEAVKAVTDLTKEAFVVNINYLCDNFKCKKCQGHFRKFIDTHPLNNYWNIKDNQGHDIGFFQWTWELHNQVNKFLGKYQPTLSEAYNFYINNEEGACFNCPENIPVQITKSIPSILELYRETNSIKPKPFKLLHRNQ